MRGPTTAPRPAGFFSLAVERLAPDVLQTLRDDVLPVYRQVGDETGRAPEPSDEFLFDNVRGWAEQHHLVVDRVDALPRRKTAVPAGEPKTLAPRLAPDFFTSLDFHSTKCD
jgi:hypothetical protein